MLSLLLKAKLAILPKMWTRMSDGIIGREEKRNQKPLESFRRAQTLSSRAQQADGAHYFSRCLFFFFFFAELVKGWVASVASTGGSINIKTSWHNVNRRKVSVGSSKKLLGCGEGLKLVFRFILMCPLLPPLLSPCGYCDFPPSQ